MPAPGDALSRSSRAVLTAALLVTLVALNQSWHLEARIRRASSGLVEHAEVLYVPDLRTLRVMFLGYDQAAADVLWLRTLSYFARHFTSDRRYDWLEHFVEQIVELDPRFRKVYHWAGANVLYGRSFTNENVLRSNVYYERALERFPHDYEAAFRLGLNYYVELRSDDPDQQNAWREKGVEYLEMAANLPDAPVFLRQLVVSLHSRQGRHHIALQHLVELMQQTDDPAQKAALRARLEAIRGDLDVDALAADLAELDRRWKSSLPYLSLPLYLQLDALVPVAATGGPPQARFVRETSWRALIPDVTAGGDAPGPEERETEP